jgi:hypothetical protein
MSRFDDRDQEKSAFSRRGTAFIGGAFPALKGYQNRR